MKKIVACGAIILFFATIFGAVSAFAVDPIPKQAGFSGFFRPGVGFVDIESNMVAEFMGNDLSKKRIDSLRKSPEGESSGTFSFAFQINYTLSNLRTQFFFGPELSDILRFDASQQLGIKQEIGDLGIVQAGFLFSGLTAEVWSDPYVVDQKRRETDRDSTGVKLAWGQIFGSGLEIDYKYRDIDIDKEQSGTFLRLSDADRKLLKRDGDIHEIEILYHFKLNGKNRFTPSFTCKMDDRDGDARKNDEYVFQVTYAYLGGDPFSFTLNAMAGWAEYDKRNPVPDFRNKKQEDDLYGLNATLYYKNPWGWTLMGSKPIDFFIDGAWAKRDANIDFYDEEIVSGTVGAMFRW